MPGDDVRTEGVVALWAKQKGWCGLPAVAGLAGWDRRRQGVVVGVLWVQCATELGVGEKKDAPGDRVVCRMGTGD